MFNKQAQGRGVRARNQAIIRVGGEQGRAAVYGCFETGATALGLSWKGILIMQNQDVDSQCSTLVVVENEIFKSRGTFRTWLSPKRVAEWVLLCIEFDYLTEHQLETMEIGAGEYYDRGPVGASITLGPNRATVRYFALDDLSTAQVVLGTRPRTRKRRTRSARRYREGRAMSQTTETPPNKPPKATEWHRWPKGYRGNCPICGLPAVKTRGAGGGKFRPWGQHRAISPEEASAANWVQRLKSKSGWKLFPIFNTGEPDQVEPPQVKPPQVEPPQVKPPQVKPPQVKPPQVKPPRRARITPETRHFILMASRMAAIGKTNEEIATALHRTPRAVELWKHDYPELWNHDFRVAMDKLLTKVSKKREALGSSAIEDEEKIAARLAARGLIDREQKIPSNPNPGEPMSLWTLLSLYEDYHPDSRWNPLPGRDHAAQVRTVGRPRADGE